MTHPLGGGRVAVLRRSVEETARGLREDASMYRMLVGSLTRNADKVFDDILGPVPLPPRHPLVVGRYGVTGALPASVLAGRFKTPEAKAMFSGLAAHAIAPLTSPFTGAVALLFAVAAHAYGWPLVRGGSRAITDALASLVTSGGSEIETGLLVGELGDLPGAKTTLLDVVPPAALRIGGNAVSRRAARRLGAWRSGPGVFKLDWALDGPIPWADDASGGAGTVHVGGTYAQVQASEALVAAGDHPARPFVIVAQQSLFDGSRAPAGKQTAWAYCHVPAGSTVDMTEAIEAQIERFAPGFRDLILARHRMGPAELQAHDPNYVGGDIAAGAFRIRKLFQLGRQPLSTRRRSLPLLRLDTARRRSTRHVRLPRRAGGVGLIAHCPSTLCRSVFDPEANGFTQNGTVWNLHAGAAGVRVNDKGKIVFDDATRKRSRSKARTRPWKTASAAS
jgi:phytoene dehydrogenase-like protein